MTAESKLYSGQTIAVEWRDNGRWRVGRAGLYGSIADPSEVLDLRVGELSKMADNDPVERSLCLLDLSVQAASSPYAYLLDKLIDELDSVIQYFHGAVPLCVATEAELAALLGQANLCRTWLDYLVQTTGQRPSLASNPTPTLLWRRYSWVLTILFEIDLASPLLEDPEVLKVFQSWTDLENEYQRSLRYWSAHLLEPSDNHPANQILQTSEEDVRNMIWRPDGRLRRFFRTTVPGQRFLDRLTRQWFLARYDLGGAGRMVHDQLDEQGAPGWVIAIYDQRFLVPRCLLGWIAIMLTVAAGVGGVAAAPWVQIWARLVAFAAALLLVFLITAIFKATWWLGRSALYPFSLRMTAGIFVGILVLSGLSDSFTAFSFRAFCHQPDRLDSLGTLMLLGFSLLTALAYAFVNALNQINDRHQAIHRAAGLFFFGMAQAIVFASFASWLVADRALISEGREGPCHALNLLSGTLYFDYVVVAGSLALVVGILTQILWENRPISDPL